MTKLPHEVRARDALALLDLPYSTTFDCGHLVIRAQRELFGLDLALAQQHPAGRRGQAALLGQLTAELAERVAVPATGDVALYVQDDADGGWHYHLGVVIMELGEAWLLHLPANGRSLLQRERDARVHGLRLEGYYRPHREASHVA
ncbi:MAG: peptidoglycan endopeptidase [Roseateles sp.]|nr:MAG: peptidoglycan endopeptidase [Roseateles sp.]